MNSSVNLSDMWAEALSGDHSAFALLHKNLYSGLYYYILHIVKDDEVTNDLLQELFVKIWQKRMQIGTINNVKAYFFTSARSMAINHFRKLKSDESRLEKFTQPEITFSSEDVIVSAESDKELKHLISLALNSLPSRQREIIYLKFYEEMEYQKIAELTGIRYQSVVNHVFRALQTLRSEYSKLKSTEVFACQ